ncbi:hypothetical protein RhiirA4_469903 [Rhizophagus irregularis]|uniref:Uncharacterized protein n=1 Tax=Rhizophagus irregularis TaxID=588596 RepID=A0A2I1H0B1_9GLOM|nr:hypothetical protein RhiirA4_469903 [Rhizophagus irregularis]
MAEQPSQKIDETTREGFPKTVECSTNHVEGNERYGCRIEGVKYENNETSEYCPNATRIRSLHMALGELCRICALGSTTGTKWGSCRFVYPHFHVRKGGSLEPMHKMPAEGGGLNESLSNLNCIKPGSNLEDYVNEVQEYGFNHIILIGVREHGIIFLDCYGRLFILDTMTGVLWPLGDTLDEAVTKPWTGELAWNVDEAGTGPRNI